MLLLPLFSHSLPSPPQPLHLSKCCCCLPTVENPTAGCCIELTSTLAAWSLIPSPTCGKSNTILQRPAHVRPQGRALGTTVYVRCEERSQKEGYLGKKKKNCSFSLSSLAVARHRVLLCPYFPPGKEGRLMHPEPQVFLSL